MQHTRAASASSMENFADPGRNIKKLGIQHGMRIADFGAGSGAYTLAIAGELSGSGAVYAIDVQKDLLRRIKNEAHNRHFHNVEIIWSDLEVPGSSKIHNHTVDLVLLSNFLFQVPDKKTPLAEAKRITKKNGRIVIIDWSESFGGMGPHKDDVFSKAAAKALASSVGLRVAEEFDAGAHHYGLMFTSGVH